MGPSLTHLRVEAISTKTRHHNTTSATADEAGRRPREPDMMADSKSCLETLNDAHRHAPASGSPSSFLLFQRLPAELRQRVWKLHLRQNRMITVEFRDSDKNKRARLLGGCRYCFGLSRCYQYSALLGTSHEARQAALEHFRVRIPSTAGDVSSRHLYLNPEYDHVFVRGERFSGMAFVDFLNDAAAGDPRGKGVLNLAATGQDGLIGYIQSLRPELLPEEAVARFRQVVVNLRALWAVHLLSHDARVMLGLFTGTTNYTTKLNKSIPIFSEATDFKMFQHDPRPIDPDLGKTTVMKDPRAVVRQWQALENRFRASEYSEPREQKSLEISYALAVGPGCGRKPVYGPKTMKRYLRMEREHWEMWEQIKPTLKGIPKRDELLSVAGFWLFPSNAFDGLQDTPGGKRVADLTGQQPALAMFEF